MWRWAGHGQRHIERKVSVSRQSIWRQAGVYCLFIHSFIPFLPRSFTNSTGIYHVPALDGPGLGEALGKPLNSGPGLCPVGLTAHRRPDHRRIGRRQLCEPGADIVVQCLENHHHLAVRSACGVGMPVQKRLFGVSDSLPSVTALHPGL